MNKHGATNNRGFSLVELSIAALILAIVTTVVLPSFSMAIRQEAAKKTALEISQIQEAARKYYVDKGSWPADFPTLAANYLDPTWAATNLNPFGYSYSVSPALSNLNVQTDIPVDVYLVAAANLQMVIPTAVAGGKLESVQSTVTPPGSLSTMPVGSIIPWPSTTLPAAGGFLWCNGQAVSRTDYSGLFAVIGTTYGAGDGSTTFNLPDTMGRTIVGVDAMGGASAANRIPLWSGLPNLNTGGSPSILGSSFGEYAHRQSVLELAPHTHNFVAYITGSKGFSGESTTAPRNNPDNGTTAIQNGAYNDGTGKGYPANVVQPSITMGYIIKT